MRNGERDREVTHFQAGGVRIVDVDADEDDDPK